MSNQFCIPLVEFCVSTPNFNAFSDAITAVATAAIFFMAWKQLHNGNRQQRVWATLQSCDRYDSDPIISSAARAFYNTGEGRKLRCELSETELGDHVRTVLNYFEAICIGMKQRLYVEDIVYDHLGSIMMSRRKMLREGANPVFREYFECLKTDFVEFDQQCDAFEKRRRCDEYWRTSH